MVIFNPPPTESTHLNQSPKFITGDNVGDPYHCVKFDAEPSMWGFREWLKYNNNFIYLFKHQRPRA